MHVFIFRPDDVHGIWSVGQRADCNFNKPIGKEIFILVHHDHLYDLLLVHRNNWQRLAIVAGYLVDKNRVIFHVDVFLVDGHYAYSVDSHGRVISDEV